MSRSWDIPAVRNHSHTRRSDPAGQSGWWRSGEFGGGGGIRCASVSPSPRVRRRTDVVKTSIASTPCLAASPSSAILIGSFEKEVDTLAPRHFLPAARTSSVAHFISISKSIMASAHSVWFRFAGFAAGVRRRSHGRVLRVPAGFLFQLHDPSDHHIVCVFERRDLLAQSGVTRSQHCVLTYSSALLCGSSSAMSYCLSQIARTVVDIRAVSSAIRAKTRSGHVNGHYNLAGHYRQ